MFVVIDYDSKVELFPASYEIREAWKKRGNVPFLKINIFGYNHKFIVSDNGIKVNNGKYASVLPVREIFKKVLGGSNDVVTV